MLFENPPPADGHLEPDIVHGQTLWVDLMFIPKYIFFFSSNKKKTTLAPRHFYGSCFVVVFVSLLFFFFFCMFVCLLPIYLAMALTRLDRVQSTLISLFVLSSISSRINIITSKNNSYYFPLLSHFYINLKSFSRLLCLMYFEFCFELLSW